VPGAWPQAPQHLAPEAPRSLPARPPARTSAVAAAAADQSQAPEPARRPPPPPRPQRALRGRVRTAAHCRGRPRAPRRPSCRRRARRARARRGRPRRPRAAAAAPPSAPRATARARPGPPTAHARQRAQGARARRRHRRRGAAAAFRHAGDSHGTHPFCLFSRLRRLPLPLLQLSPRRIPSCAPVATSSAPRDASLSTPAGRRAAGTAARPGAGAPAAPPCPAGALASGGGAAAAVGAIGPPPLHRRLPPRDTTAARRRTLCRGTASQHERLHRAGSAGPRPEPSHAPAPLRRRSGPPVCAWAATTTPTPPAPVGAGRRAGAWRAPAAPLWSVPVSTSRTPSWDQSRPHIRPHRARGRKHSTFFVVSGSMGTGIRFTTYTQSDRLHGQRSYTAIWARHPPPRGARRRLCNTCTPEQHAAPCWA
jgi:hypothetical protein